MNLQKIAEDYELPIEEVRARWLTLMAAIWKSNFRQFAKDIIRIRTKTGELAPLLLNSAQLILHNAANDMLKQQRWVRLAGLKGRRQGFSTYVAARGYWRATLWDRQQIYILSHEMTSSNALFDMVALMQEKNAFPPAVGTDNAKELEFVKRGSSYAVATAGQKAGGRGRAISFFHGSEAAWWTNAKDHFAASVQAVDEVRGVWGCLWSPPENPLPFEKGRKPIYGWILPPSEIWLETTSAGPTGEFHQRYREAMKKIGRYQAVFVPWVVQPEYQEEGDFTPEPDPPEEGELAEAEYQDLHNLTDAQMLWRRSKIIELGDYGKFKQEYPIDVTEAFSSADMDGVFIKPAKVLRARKRNLEMPDAPLILGVDPAGSGGDRFAVAFRRGDKVFKVIYRQKIEHEEAVAWLSSLIEEHKPNRMNIDRGSMGAAIVTTLRNISPKFGEIVRGVDFGGTSKSKQVNPRRAGPWNRRAEIYGELDEWLKDGDIPDDDDIASDLSGPKIKYRANNDWLLESKTEMKSRGLRSCDLSDAIALTFAWKEWFATWSKPKQATGFENGQVRIVAADGTQAYEAELSGDYGWMG